MSGIIDDIKENSTSDLRVCEEEHEELIEDYIEEFIDALAHNTSIRTVHFEGEFFGCINCSDRSKLIRTISRIPSLEEVHINRSCVLVKDIAALVATATQLRVLKLNYIVFQGVESEHETCEKMLFQSTSLQRFDLCQCSSAAVNKNASLEKLERAGQMFQSMRPIKNAKKTISNTNTTSLPGGWRGSVGDMVVPRQT